MNYILATTENILHWYRFDVHEDPKPGGFTTQVELDLNVIPQFKNKETATKAAIALGLKTWRYVRIS